MHEYAWVCVCVWHVCELCWSKCSYLWVSVQMKGEVIIRSVPSSSNAEKSPVTWLTTGEFNNTWSCSLYGPQMGNNIYIWKLYKNYDFSHLAFCWCRTSKPFYSWCCQTTVHISQAPKRFTHVDTCMGRMVVEKSQLVSFLKVGYSQKKTSNKPNMDCGYHPLQLTDLVKRGLEWKTTFQEKSIFSGSRCLLGWWFSTK